MLRSSGLRMVCDSRLPIKPLGGLKSAEVGQTAKLADPRNVVASGCVAPRFLRFALPLASLAA